MRDDARVERLRNDHVAVDADAEVEHAFRGVFRIGDGQFFLDVGGDVPFRQFGQSQGGGQFHLFVDVLRTRVQRAAEDAGEAQNVVDLVRVVAAARADDCGAGGDRHVGEDFRNRIGHREDDRILRHRLDHVARHAVRSGEAQEDVGPDHRLGQRAERRVDGELLLLRIQIRAALVDDAFAVAHDEILFAGARRDVEAAAADAGRACAVHDEAAVFDLLAQQLEGVHDGGHGDDRRAMLVVMEDRDAHALLQRRLDFEAGGGGDVFKVDAAERRFEAFRRGDDLRGIRAAFFVEHLAKADRNGVDISEVLEQHGFAFHHGQTGLRADVAKAENGGAIAHDGDHVAAARVFPHRFRLVFDFQAGLCDAGRIGQRELVARVAGLRRNDGHLAGLAVHLVEIQCLLSQFFFCHPKNLLIIVY